MPTIYRPKVSVGACTTLAEKSVALGGQPDLLRNHKKRSTVGFPKVVARFGNAELYVEAELDAFYKSVMWRQSDAALARHAGE